MKKKPSTPETNAIEAELVYLPFYMLLDHLEDALRDAFIPCYIESRSSQRIGGKNTSICKLSLFEQHSDKTVYLPEHFTIRKSELHMWGYKIANWFIESARQHCEVPNDSAAAELTQLLVTTLSKDGETVPAMSPYEAHELMYEILADPNRFVVTKP